MEVLYRLKKPRCVEIGKVGLKPSEFLPRSRKDFGRVTGIETNAVYIAVGSPVFPVAVDEKVLSGIRIKKIKYAARGVLAFLDQFVFYMRGNDMNKEIPLLNILILFIVL